MIQKILKDFAGEVKGVENAKGTRRKGKGMEKKYIKERRIV